MPAAQMGFSGYVQNENWYSIKPRLSGLKPGVFFFHGAGGEELALEPTWSPNASRLMWGVAEYYSVFAPDTSDGVSNPPGSHTWGNDGSTDTLDAAITFAQSNNQFQMTSGKVLLVGTSMGFITATNYARRFPAKVAGLIGIAGATDIDYHYANGFAANIDAAYGGSWATNGKLTNHSPKDFAGSLPFPCLYYYADDDTTVPAAARNDFLSTYKGLLTVKSMGLGGHTDTPWANIDRQDILRFAGTIAW